MASVALGIGRLIFPEFLRVVVESLDGSATCSGLLKGDQLVSINGQPINRMRIRDIRSKLDFGEVGDTVRLTVVRNQNSSHSLQMSNYNGRKKSKSGVIATPIESNKIILDYEVQREYIIIPQVEYSVLRNCRCPVGEFDFSNILKFFY